MKLIDYVFSSISVSNADGTMATTAIDCNVVGGPGTTPLGDFPNALDLGTNGHLQVDLDATQVQTDKFSVRLVFKANGLVTARQNLVESNCLPFSMFLDASPSGGFRVVVSIAPVAHGWSGTTTEFFINLSPQTWYTADLVYDTDTLAVFIDGVLYSVHAYPFGQLNKFGGNQLFIGTWVDGARNHFDGQVAAFQWFNGEIPIELEQQLDERRSHPEWYLSYKQEAISRTISFGAPLSRYAYDAATDAYLQFFERGLVMYHDSLGMAFEMHGAIFERYKSMENRAELGFLVSDEFNGAKSGSRRNLFSKGGIYWSAATGALPVTGQIYLDYEHAGESGFIGLPISAATAINGGREQFFEGARMYHKTNSPKAFEVHGAILAKFLQTGGINVWGYPTSNESDLKKGALKIGKVSEFEVCNIYWSPSTGAFEVHGDILKKYKDLNGVLGALGFPTSDEGNIPSAAGAARFNTFQNGSILWFGSFDNMFVCQAFNLFLGRVDSKESEGFLMGQNDIYLRVRLHDNGNEIFNKRFPDAGDFNGRNVVDINQQISQNIIPNSPNRNINVNIDVWESDGGAPFGGGDDHLGVYNKVLNMANAWGLRENNGIFNSGAFDKINSITWSVRPQVNINALTNEQKWWGVTNKGTKPITYPQYAAAFRDVDSESEAWDLSDWLEKAFYELVAKGIAGGGNCFGMSLEAIYSLKNRSILGMPIDRFTTWNTVANEFNIKHQYQVGAAPIWWFVGQFLSGNTHAPVDVFNATRIEHARGNNPVLCISQNYDFSGAPHCIMPIGWDTSSNPWKMQVCDPNFPKAVKTLLVDPVKNEFNYLNNKYTGGQFLGGRMHYMPYSVLQDRPRTPIWEAILLILGGTILILGEDAQTVSLLDENGVDLNAFGADSVNRLKTGQSLAGKFVAVKGFDGKAVSTRINPNVLATSSAAQLRVNKKIIPSEMYLRRNNPTQQFTHVRPSAADIFVNASNLTLADLAATQVNSAVASRFDVLRTDALLASMQNRNIGAIANDTNLVQRLNPEIAALLTQLVNVPKLTKNFKHQLKGINNGFLNYVVKDKLSEFIINTAIKNQEASTFDVKNLGTSSGIVNMTAAENKTVRLEINNKLGIGKDNINIVIDKIPAAIGKALSLNIKPGLSGIDILTTAERVNANVSVVANINGQVLKSNFGLDIEGGIRLRPSTILSSGELKIGKIDTLFGQLRNSNMVKKT